MYGTASTKDDLLVQHSRLERLISQLAPNLSIEFDPKATKQIRFRIVDKRTGNVVGHSGDGIWLVSVIADKSDAELKHLFATIAGLSAGRQ